MVVDALLVTALVVAGLAVFAVFVFGLAAAVAWVGDKWGDAAALAVGAILFSAIIFFVALAGLKTGGKVPWRERPATTQPVEEE